MPVICRLSGFLRVAALLLLVADATGAAAEPVARETHYFRLSIRGFPAGSIRISAAKTKTRYALAGSMQPNAFLRMLRDVGYAGKANGTYVGTKYTSRDYSGGTKTGTRSSKVRIRFRHGRPIVDEYSPSREKRPYDINPAAQKGTMDILTSAYLIFVDSPADALCNRTMPMFDGRRRTKITLSKPSISAKGATCTGTYTRLAGFPAAELKERVNFPFTLVYDRLDDGSYRLNHFRTQTTFGTAKAVRR